MQFYNLSGQKGKGGGFHLPPPLQATAECSVLVQKVQESFVEKLRILAVHI
jgi:hypothetical protein